MHILIVSYDLNGHEPSESYKRLFEAIHSQGKAIWSQYSTWIIATDKSEVQVRNYLMNFTDNNDTLFIGTLSSFASYNISKEVTNLISSTWNPQPNIQLLLKYLSNVNKAN